MKIMTQTIEQIEQQIVEEFSVFTEWMDKYAYLIEMADALPPFPDARKTPQTLIEGCQSRVWLDAEYNDDRIFYYADSDAIITKGIVALLVRVFTGQQPQNILSAQTTFIDQIGLRQNLSPTRANGLNAMLKQIKLYAIAFAQNN
jgi:cysteine desulfuration protein SufE